MNLFMNTMMDIVLQKMISSVVRKGVLDMLKLREWNEVLDYADQIEEELTSEGYNVRLHEYSMYNGEHGIYLTLYDNHNKVHQQYASGVHNNVKEYKRYIDYYKRKLIEEC